MSNYVNVAAWVNQLLATPAEQRALLSPTERAHVLQFLESGTAVSVEYVVLRDPFDSGPEPRGFSTRAKYTDGVWNWDGRVTAIVLTYSYAPPADFLDYMRSVHYDARTKRS